MFHHPKARSSRFSSTCLIKPVITKPLTPNWELPNSGRDVGSSQSCCLVGPDSSRRNKFFS